MSVKTTTVQAHQFKIFVEIHSNPLATERIILVNGALATTASFRQAAAFLVEHYEVILFDMPHMGQSLVHNDDCKLLTHEEEGLVLASLIERFTINHVISVSWGGLAALLAMSDRPPSLMSGVVSSFAWQLNAPMLDYVTRGRQYIEAGRYRDAARLLNDTVGHHLPRLLKVVNQRYLMGMSESVIRQTKFHAEQILALDFESYRERLSKITVPVRFINGALDIYTPAEDIRKIGQSLRLASFSVIPDAGHFLELEGRESCEAVRTVVIEFLREASDRFAAAGQQETAGERLAQPPMAQREGIGASGTAAAHALPVSTVSSPTVIRMAQ